MYFDRRLWDLTLGLRGRIALAAFLGILATFAGIARFVLLGTLLARVFSGAALPELAPPILWVAGVILLRGALDHARTLIAHGTASHVQERLRGMLYDKIAALGPAWFAADRTGGVMLSMVDGVEQLQTFFGQYLPQVCVAAIAPVAILAVMVWWDAPVTAVMVVAALLTLVMPVLFHRNDRRSSTARQQAFKAFGEEFLDTIQGLPTLKAFGQSTAYGRILAVKARALSDRTMWVLSTGLMTRGIADLGVAAGAAAALALGAYRVSAGAMTLEALLIVLMAGTEIFRPLRDLRSVLHQGMVGQSAAAGINAILGSEAPKLAGAGAPVATLTPTIAFDDVGFAYPGGRGAAHDGLSFSVAAGERVGIVGPSGSGKSSIVRLLLRFHDAQEGRILVGGRDLATLDPEQIRTMIAVVQQDTTLFHGTVEENLRLGKADASQAELEAAAHAANAHEFIAALPEGYATMIGERGAKLSGGQRQRIAIARAILRDAPILILDEALSAVDAENDAAIRRALDRLMQGRTTLILAHRLSSVIDADRILVIDHGKVAESGRHHELMQHDGPYRRLMGAQAAGDDIAIDAPRAAGDGRAPDAVPAEHEVAETPITSAEHVSWAQTFGLLMRVTRPWSGQLTVTVLSGILRVAAMIGVGVIGALIVARVKNAVPFDLLVIALAVVAPLAGLLHWLESWLAHDMAYRLLAEMRVDLFAKLDALAPAYLLNRRSGDLVALATQDVETVEYFFAHTMAPAIVGVLVPASVLALLFAAAWPVAVALLPFLLWAGLSPVLRRRRIDRLGAEARGRLGTLGAFVTDTIQGLAELIAYQAVARRRASFMDAVRRYQAIRLKLLADMSLQAAALDVATGLGGLAVAVAGASLVVGSTGAWGTLDAGTLPLLILLATASFLPVSEIAQAGRQLADTIASTRRLHAVHAEPVRIADGTQVPAIPKGGSAVTFAGVSFCYPGRTRPALSRVSLDVPAGATVALVGSSGAGKTTLANLVLRFWDPDTGTIALDGVDLRELALDPLRQRIALVAQDTYLFNDTLRANVRLARPDADDAAIRQALDQAALASFVAGLPEGLDTKVGERGVQLSGGQRQRVAIARAFLKNAPVLILDEATSHLDAISEAQVRDALARLMRNRTTIVIAHRLSTVRDADLIAVLDAGRVVETGTHATLLARGGLYAHLIGSQIARPREALAAAR
jgi:ATP-binding cassette subfamily C protein CydCD